MVTSIRARPVEVTSPRRAWLAVFAALNAVSAYAGGVGLATGLLEFEDASLTRRLPFDSPVFGGFALMCVVAVPFTVVAAGAWRGDVDAGRTATAAGALLIAWILVELVFLRELSWFHPTYTIIGGAFVIVGRRPGRSRP